MNCEAKKIETTSTAGQLVTGHETGERACLLASMLNGLTGLNADRANEMGVGDSFSREDVDQFNSLAMTMKHLANEMTELIHDYAHKMGASV